MTGRDYLEDIRTQLVAGRHQHRMGENVLRAFGYVRRRATAIEEINATLESLGLVADPPVEAEMPLRSPRIRFSLATEAAAPDAVDGRGTLATKSFDAPLPDTEDNDGSLPEPAFSISELASANTTVESVTPGASIQEAYTKMSLHKYSQLVVASQAKPRQQDIKGIVSFQSIAKALMNGKPTTVGDCVDKGVSLCPNRY